MINEIQPEMRQLSLKKRKKKLKEICIPSYQGVV